MKTILVTGGTGFIGSHTCTLLLSAGYDVVIVDNLSYSRVEIVEKLQQITNKSPIFYPIDIRDRVKLTQVFDNHNIDGVIHFAAAKSVGESMKNPLHYYENNILGTYNLLKEMQQAGVCNIIFSSSCTVYGNSAKQPLQETDPKQACVSPYGWTKSINEDMIQGLCQTHTTSACILRYFNPVGAHPTGLIGEYSQGVPSYLLPYVMQTLLGYYDHVRVFGNDYDTPDGTAMRDYIHVMDLAQAHIQALDWILEQPLGTYDVFNIGTGKPYSVLDIIQITEQVTQRQVPYHFYPRRPGDVQIAYADPSKAMSILGWKPCKTIPDAISDMRNFCQQSGQV